MAAVLAAFLLAGCASWHTASQVNALLPTDVILLGEQHDVAEHQRIEARAVRQLVIRDKLAALVVEMADAGQDTRALSTDATEAAVREALEWNDKAWPWAQYGPAVMEAVRAGVPVLGGNLPRRLFSSAMADHALDATLPPPALAAQQAAIRHGHCDLLAASQLLPMTRIQIARDQSMARTLQAAARSGQAVLLLAGSGHVDRELGVPLHLPASLAVRVVRLQAGGEAKPSSSFDTIWTTPQATGKDYCADLRLRLGQ
jgi:uncharacterized iron-regulated protein